MAETETLTFRDRHVENLCRDETLIRLETETSRPRPQPCIQILHSHILAALLHGTPAAVTSQTLGCATRNGIMELSQRVPPIFGWAAITLGIGAHSCFV